MTAGNVAIFGIISSLAGGLACQLQRAIGRGGNNPHPAAEVRPGRPLEFFRTKLRLYNEIPVRPKAHYGNPLYLPERT